MKEIYRFNFYDFNKRKVVKRIEKEWDYGKTYPLCYWQMLGEFYPECKVEDHQGDKKRVPDFKLINKKNPKDYFWVEMKGDGDGLKENQLNWMFLNPKEKIIILFLKFLRIE
jgi:hypothetical protein